MGQQRPTPVLSRRAPATVPAAPPRAILLAGLALSLALPTGAAKDRDEKIDDWRPVPVTGSVTIHKSTACDRLVGEGDGKIRLIHRSKVLATARITRATPGGDPDDPSVRSQGRFETNVDIYQEMSSEAMKLTVTQKGQATQAAEGIGCLVEVSDKARKYRLHVPAVTGKVTRETSASVIGMPAEKNTEKIAMTVSDEHHLDKKQRDVGYFDFNPREAVIKGNFSEVVAMPFSTEPGGLPLSELAGATEEERQVMVPVNVVVTWNLSLKPLDAEVELRCIGNYDDWLPDPDRGTPLLLEVSILKPKGAKGTFRFRVQKTSKEPGTCLNDPPSNPDTGPDVVLETPADASPPLEIAPGGQSAESTEPARAARVGVKAEDFGAFAQVIAEATITSGGASRTVQAVCRAGPGERSFLAVPRDDNQNDIADCWEKKVGANDAEADDEAAPGDPARKGDGLTVYEEYRGFKVKGKHLRTDPARKDLFIVDADDLVRYSAAMAGAFGPLETHLLDPPELQRDSRWVNFRNKSHHQVDQCGLIVKNGPLPDGYGLAMPPPWMHGNPMPGPPKDTEAIVVDCFWIQLWLARFIAGHKDELADSSGELPPEWQRGMRRMLTSLVVTHEIGHGIGVCHHSPTGGGITTCPVRYPPPTTGGGSVLGMLSGKHPWPDKLCSAVDNCLDKIVVSDR